MVDRLSECLVAAEPRAGPRVKASVSSPVLDCQEIEEEYWPVRPAVRCDSQGVRETNWMPDGALCCAGTDRQWGRRGPGSANQGGQHETTADGRAAAFDPAGGYACRLGDASGGVRLGR